MPTLVLSNFTGITPRLGAQYLPDNAAQKAVNAKLFSGEIRPWMKPVEEYVPVNPNAISIFKMNGPGNTSKWLEWVKDTDVVRGPVVDETDYRIYYSEDGTCKKTNWSLATAGSTGAYPRDWLHMGVPAPETAPTLSATRTTIGNNEYDPDNTENRAYVYTYVSEFGSVWEESAPSPPADIICDIVGNPVNVSGFAKPPTEHYNITHIRLYRAVGGSSDIIYMLVDEFELDNSHEFPASGTSMNNVAWTSSTYPDSISYTALGKELDSLNYTPPPSNLRGLVMMANGFMAGFKYNQIWFSEPFIPHAWPTDYMLSVDAEIVGLGVYGSTLVVCTKAHCYTISGTHPSSLAQEKQPMVQPCISKQSIAYDQYGVLYASPHGLVALAAGQMDVFSRPLITRDEWQNLYTPSTLKSAMYNNMYVGAYHRGNDQGLVIFSRGDQPAMIEMDFPSTALHVEYGTGVLYALNAYDHKIYRIDGSSGNRMTFDWMSKEFAFGYRMTFTAAKVDAQLTDYDKYKAYKALYDEMSALNEQIWQNHDPETGLQGAVNRYSLNQGYCIGGGILKPLPEKVDAFFAKILFYVDDKLIYSKTVVNDEIFRIPAITGYRWSIGLAGNMPVRKVIVGTTVNEVNEQ